MSFELDSHDTDDMTEKLIKSLLNSPIIKKQKTKKVLAIGEIENNTKQNIDIEMIVSEITNLLNESGKFEIVNAGQNAKIEQLIRDSRKMREDKEYNPYETIEEGELIPPHYGLTGKISQKNKTIGDDEIVEYVFSLTLTSLKSGKILWARKTKPISKKLPKEEVENFNNYQKDEGPSAWEKVKDFFSADGKNYFTASVDFGLGGGSINMPPIDFNIVEGRKTTPHSMWIDDRYSTAFAMPINIRIGYLRDIGDNWAFALNFLYNYMYVSSFSGYDLESTASSIDIESDSKKLTSTIQRIGGEFVLYYKVLNWLHIYAGGGVLKDFGSKYKVSFEAYRGYYSDTYINEKGQRRFELEQKIDSWYPLVKFGILWNFHNYIGATTDLTCSWALKEENYLGLNCGLVLGVQFKI